MLLPGTRGLHADESITRVYDHLLFSHQWSTCCSLSIHLPAHASKLVEDSRCCLSGATADADVTGSLVKRRQTWMWSYVVHPACCARLSTAVRSWISWTQGRRAIRIIHGNYYSAHDKGIGTGSRPDQATAWRATVRSTSCVMITLLSDLLQF